MYTCFLSEVKRENGEWNKGIVIKTGETLEDAINACKQAFHAYLGAYAYGNNPNCDYVNCMIFTYDGLIIKSEIYNRRENENGCE